jgi:hypothetical protein
MADETRELPVTTHPNGSPRTLPPRIQFQPIGGALYMLTVDGEAVGDFQLAPEAGEWFFSLPTAEQMGKALDEMRTFLESQGVTL